MVAYRHRHFHHRHFHRWHPHRSWYKEKKQNWKFKDFVELIFIILLIAIGYYILYTAENHFFDFLKNPTYYIAGEKKLALDAFSYLNQIRANYGEQPLTWNEQLYNLAVFRSKDMVERNYLDHVTPEGKCAADYASQFGLEGIQTFHNAAEVQAAANSGVMVFRSLAENVGGVSYDASNGEPVEAYTKAIDAWLESRGHRYALLYPNYDGAAVGCYKSICVFLGLTTNPAPFMCETGAEGLDYWKTAPLQPNEIPS